MEEKVLFFDGVCNLCNGAVQFIISNEKDHSIRFASLQSAYGQHFLQEHNLPTKKFHSMIFLHNGHIYTQSKAVMQIAKHLKYPYRLIYLFNFIPIKYLDLIYEKIALHRYDWFGKKDQCMLPSPMLKERFIT